MKAKSLLYLLLFILFCSCGDSSTSQIDGTQEISVNIVFNKNISENATDPMPASIKAFIQPIEGGKMPFIPKVTFIRLDLSKDSVFIFKMPVETANGLRKRFGTYDYGNLKDDYNENLPTLQLGNYLTHNSVNKSSYNFLVTSDDVTYHLIMNRDSTNQDSIIKDIKNVLITKNQSPKRFIIFYDNPHVAVQQQASRPDSVAIPPKPPTKFSTPIPVKEPKTGRSESVSGSGLEGYFHQLANPNISYESKSSIREKILQYFASSNADVIFVNSSQETSTGTTISKYVKTISMTNRQVTVVDKKMQDGKIFEIYVSEK